MDRSDGFEARDNRKISSENGITTKMEKADYVQKCV